MSKNRNRARLILANNNREYNIINKHFEYGYCYICQRRAGSFYASCSPADMHAKGVHGSGKRIFKYKYREYKTWKYNRLTRWRQ